MINKIPLHIGNNVFPISEDKSIVLENNGAVTLRGKYINMPLSIDETNKITEAFEKISFIKKVFELEKIANTKTELEGNAYIEYEKMLRQKKW